MSEYAEQLRRVCAWNRRLSRSNSLLRIKLRSAEHEVRRLTLANANLATERDAIDAALGAMDEALKGKGS